MIEKERLNTLISKFEKVILFGASVNGEACFQEIEEKNKNRICGFTDNFSEKKMFLNLPVFSVTEALRSDAKILITSKSWMTICRQMIDAGDSEKIIGAFVDGNVLDTSGINVGEEVKKEELLKRIAVAGEDQLRVIYRNDAHIILDQAVNEEIKKKVRMIEQTGDLYRNLWEVNMELSNLCNYSMIHPKCPTCKFREKRILPAAVVYQLLDELSEMEFEGIIRFGSYNEVLIDPRLFLFIEYAKKHVRNARIFLYSNGFYLNDIMAKELKEAGVDELTVTAYGDKEWERLRKLQIDIPYKILMCKTPMSLDDRLQLYDRPYNCRSTPCIEDMMFRIDAAEHLRLCCLDWKTEEYRDLGKISNHSIKEWANNERVLNNIMDLLKGNRNCDLCKRCDWHNMLEEM